MRRLTSAIVALFALGLASPAAAAWHEARSKHFLIYANDSPRLLAEFAGKLERFDQAVRQVRGMADPELTDSGRVTLFLLPNERSIERLAGAGVRGFYRGTAAGNFAFVATSNDIEMVSGSSVGVETIRNLLGTQEIFFHEYAHHLQLQESGMAMPSWVSEGFAEYFATAAITPRGDVVIGRLPAYRKGEFFATGDSVAERLMAAQTAHSNVYGRGAVMVNYLALNPARRGQLRHYIEAINEGRKPIDAASAAFGDLKKLDRDVDSYLDSRQHLGLTVDNAVLRVPTASVRPLSPGETAIMTALIRAKAGVTSATAEANAAEARKAAALYPGEALVQTVLAEAEIDAKHFEQADAAAGRALTANPSSVQALVLKGRAQMALAKSGKPTPADWDKVRGWFSKANRLDTENAEALAMFYQTYVEAKQPVPKNAVDALLYAVDLAPRDSGLRMSAAGQLLTNGDLGGARPQVAALAFDPHAGDAFKDRGRQILDAIDAEDGKRAVALMNGWGEDDAAAASITAGSVRPR